MVSARSAEYGWREVTFHRDPDRTRGPRQGGSPARGRAASPVIGLQHALGNRGTGQVLARRPVAQKGTFEHSVRIGKLGPVEVAESNVADWTSHKAGAEDLVITTVKGRHSGDLQRLADGRTRVDRIEVQVLTGQNSWAVVTFKNAVIRGYEADPEGKHESWTAIRFDGVDIRRTSIGVPRP